MMKKNNPNTHLKTEQLAKGQVFIIIAAAFLVLVAFVGLAVDAGLTFIAYGKLARAVDFAALAAAAQFREGRSVAEMQDTAENAMTVNGVNFTGIEIELCDYEAPIADRDPQLCTEPYHKKLVRVTVTADIPLAFLRAIGFENISLTSRAISEAASMDVVLVIDISESMAWDAASGDPLRDPSVCNSVTLYPGTEDSGEFVNFPGGFPGECHPFEEVKNAASEFVLRILDKEEAEEEDRLSIVTFGNGWSGINMGTGYRTSGWTSDSATALGIIQNLTIFEPEPCLWDDGSDRQPFGACIRYDYDQFPPTVPPVFNQVGCLSCQRSGDLSGLTSTNIGGGLLYAGDIFAHQTREDALWVVILLTDGMANATTPDIGVDDITNYGTYPMGYCPNNWTVPLCQDENVFTRHLSTNTAQYDADDYARDMADFVGCYPSNPADGCNGQLGQGAVIFTVGLGNGVLDTVNEVNGLPYGTTLLRYIAAVGDDGDPASDPCSTYYEDAGDWQEWCGNYYFSPQGDQLSEVFQDIASRVFTRLNR